MIKKPFQRFPGWLTKSKPLKRFLDFYVQMITGLKPGVNESPAETTMNTRQMNGILALAILTIFSFTAGASAQNDSSIDTFWAKFKAAVIKGDKESVAAMTQFPIGMPYGQAAVRTKAQLLKRYRQVFNSEANAAKCFADAKPEKDPARPKEFTIGCDNGSGEKVVIYAFSLTKAGWKFKSLDNINE